MGIETSGAMFSCISTDIMLPSDLYVHDGTILSIDPDDRDLNMKFFKEKNYTIEYSKTDGKICGIRINDNGITFTITGCEVAY